MRIASRNTLTRHTLGVLATGTALALLSGCVTVPMGPAIAVMPSPAKSFEQFRADDAGCRNYAQSAISGAAQAANDNAASTAAAGAMVGALTGALIGAAAGDAGAGAAIGAGTGLLWGSAAGAPYYSSYDLQRRYDIHYAQCMYARGHQVPGRATYRVAPGGYPPASAAVPGSYPPPGTPAPSGVVPAPYNPPPQYPPPGTPPPRL
jgi:hypothetical protein